MTTVLQFLSELRAIEITPGGPLVEQTIAGELISGPMPGAAIRRSTGSGASAGTLRVKVLGGPGEQAVDSRLRALPRWGYFRILPGGGAEILASAPHLLFWLYTHVVEDWGSTSSESHNGGTILTPTYPFLRPSYDSFLTQHNRTAAGFHRDEHIRNLARLGFTHAEVNGLAFPVPFERGPKGEVLHRFYTYCPALDQFVTSFLNRGIYDQDYLQANLNSLKTNAALAEKYGLRSGLTCFEPRSVPDALLEKYPMLRGARVDHPIRSWHPRFNLSIAHPVVRDHYAEMMENLLREVPQIDYLAVWSNDSGAGFEYTSSLYVGRNGGGYVIREWKGDKEIAEAAANNLIRFHRLLRDAGRKVNPRFRTLLRLEAFATELQYLWPQLEDGIDVEATSLVSKGWDVDYHHPKYKERRSVGGTALFNAFAPEEKAKIDDLRKRGADADVYFTPGAFWNHEPLLGIPYPRLVFEKMSDLAARGITTGAYTGGTTPRSLAPYNINEELVRAFQANRGVNLGAFLEQKALEWFGTSNAESAVAVWRHSDEAYRSFPVPVQIYSNWGVWYRVLTRPIIPNIEAITERDRAYYEDFLLAPPHNRCRVDFRHDVGFDLIQPDDARQCLDLINNNVLPEVERAVALAATMLRQAGSNREKEAATDLHDRMIAMKCWYRNQRNITAWIAGVHRFLENQDEEIRKESREILHGMVLDEIENAKELLHLWETSRIPWIVISGVGETTFIHYRNFGEHLKLKIRLMQGHENDEPYIDPDFQWRVPGITPAKGR